MAVSSYSVAVVIWQTQFFIVNGCDKILWRKALKEEQLDLWRSKGH